MKIWIPKCGDAIALERDWLFNLHYEYRNTHFAEVMRPRQWPKTFNYRSTPPKNLLMCLHEKTVLVFDRIYIRQDADDFASVTFIIKHSENDELVGERFWVTLGDVNTIEAYFESSDNDVGIGAQNHYKNVLKDTKDPQRIVKRAEKAAKDAALASAKATCANEIAKSAWSNLRIEIATELYKKAKAEHDKWHINSTNWRYYKTVEAFEQNIILGSMQQGNYETNGGWRCISTKRLPNDVVQRNFSFGVYDNHHKCFTITSRETYGDEPTWELISVAAYV